MSLNVSFCGYSERCLQRELLELWRESKLAEGGDETPQSGGQAARGRDPVEMLSAQVEVLTQLVFQMQQERNEGRTEAQRNQEGVETQRDRVPQTEEALSRGKENEVQSKSVTSEIEKSKSRDDNIFFKMAQGELEEVYWFS